MYGSTLKRWKRRSFSCKFLWTNFSSFRCIFSNAPFCIRSISVIRYCFHEKQLHPVFRRTIGASTPCRVQLRTNKQKTIRFCSLHIPFNSIDWFSRGKLGRFSIVFSSETIFYQIRYDTIDKISLRSCIPSKNLHAEEISEALLKKRSR